MVDYIKENNQIKHRAIRLNGIALNQYVLTKNGEGYCQKNKENNTSINNKEEYKGEIFDCDWLDGDETD